MKYYYLHSAFAFHSQLCELQIQVLEKTKTIAELQSKLTDILIKNPDTLDVIPGLKDTLRSIDDTHIR